MQQLDDDIFVNTYPSNFLPQFSLVMPVHNEAGSIEQVVMDIYNELCLKIPLEIILSEDGSKDKTKEIILNLSKKIPLKAIMSYQKRGYAGGIKEGLKYVSSPFVIVSDSDGQHRPEDFWKLKEKLEEMNFRHDLIISGNRKSRADAQHRKVMSKVFQKLSSMTFDLPPMKDITSAFKLMDSDIARKLAEECKYMKESFWTEFVIRACNKKIQIIEVPVQHIERTVGETVVYKKSKIPKIALSQIKSLIKLRKELSGKNFFRAIIGVTIIKQLITFVLIGASGAGIVLFLTWLGVRSNLHYLASAAIGIETSILWAFMLNNKFTFNKNNHQSKLIQRFLKYHGTALAGLCLNLFILYVLTENGIFYLLSETLALSIVFLFNFTMSRKWVWR